MRTGWGLVIAAVSIGVALAPAGTVTAEPANPRGNAYQTIGQLESAGYDVVIDRIGNAPLGECFVTNVRNPQQVTETIPVGEGKHRDYITVVVSQSITVSLNCDV
jgi:hypothetical protein